MRRLWGLARSFINFIFVQLIVGCYNNCYDSPHPTDLMSLADDKVSYKLHNFTIINGLLLKLMLDKDQTYLQTCYTEENFHDVFEILRNKEVECLRRGQFAEAEEAKNKFSKLKEEQARVRQEMLQTRNKENAREVERQGEESIQEFQREWEIKLRTHIEQAKRQEEGLQRQHDKQLEDFTDKLMSEEIPKVKFGPLILSLRKNLENQIKVRDYKQAEVTRDTLIGAEEEETSIWRQKYEEKKKHRYEQLIKKQENQFKALRVKLQSQFNEKIKEREVKFHILLKKNQKKKIEQAKLNQTSNLQLSRDLSRTLCTINRPLPIYRPHSRSSEKKPKQSAKTWFG